jgi:exopolysaccharide biosynthesis protein
MTKAMTKPGTSGPDSRDPGDARGNPIQRNNRTSISMADHGTSTGKAVVAQCIAQKKLIVLAQPDGASTGITLDDLRDKLVAAGVENAVFLDGSDSVTFYAQGSIQIAPGKNKDRTIPAGLGFRA